VAAVAELVDGGSLVAADALLEHVRTTPARDLRLRLFGGLRRLLYDFLTERGEDRGALFLARLGRDLDLHEPGA
jgi:hypothetical protein